MMQGNRVRASIVFMLMGVCEIGLAREPAQLSQKQRDLVVARQLSEVGRCTETPAVVVCADPTALQEVEQREFLELADRGAVAIRDWLGDHFDPPGGKNRPTFFIAHDVGIPHVTILQEPWIFMHPDTVVRGMAPYLHEMVHVMAQWSWRHSEWIGEGFANYAAAAVVDRSRGYHRSFVLPDGLARLDALFESPEGREVMPLIGPPGRRHQYQGTLKALHVRMMRDRRAYAPAYYALSWSFVSYVIEAEGLDGFRRLAGDQAADSREESSMLPQIVRLRNAWIESMVEGTEKTARAQGA